MAEGEGSSEPEDLGNTTTQLEPLSDLSRADPRTLLDKDEDDQDDEDTEVEEDEDEDEEEPRLKYATLTKNLNLLYRNGDATSACMVAGDKMIVGTQNGIIHVLTMPSLQLLRSYKAHNESVSAISISPYPPPLPTSRTEPSQRLATLQAEESERAAQGSPNSKKTPRQPPVPKIPSNDIYIATSSIDGHVCVASLVDPDDVQLRNFGRPLQAVALSPDYKSDRSYLSGGKAGTLVLTTGGQKGKSANASTTGAAAAASGWLGSIGLGANTGSDKVLHSGEGIISTIKWSLSGKYVLWVNEQGIKIRRSHLHLGSSESSLEWKAVTHIDRPSRPGWEDMAGLWKARAEWVDRQNLESDEDSRLERTDTTDKGARKMSPPARGSGIEEVIVGWGDAVWILRVVPDKDADDKKTTGSSARQVEIAAYFHFNDCTVSGVSLYTANLLLVLAHMEKKVTKPSKKSTETTKQGRSRRLNGLEPELRIVDITSEAELDSETLPVSRFEGLSSTDYHLSVLPQTSTMAQLTQKGYLETLGSGVSAVGSGLYTGVETVGQGMFDATMYGPRRLGVNRLFSSGESVRSARIGNEGSPAPKGTNYLTGWIPGLGSSIVANDEATAVATTHGMKIFVFSPYDCVVGVKRNLTDRLQWLVKMQQYQQAWELLDEHPEAAGPGSDVSGISSPPTPSKASSIAHSTSSQLPAVPRPKNTLAEFFADSASMASSRTPEAARYSKAEREKRRIGELWLQQTVDAKNWSGAGEIAGKVLDTTDRWEHWIWMFLKNKRFDEISSVVPTFQITPPLKPLVFEMILGHYVSHDRSKFQELLDQWPSDLFDISSVTSAIEEQLSSDTANKGSDDWRILQECLAKLFLADGHYKEALRCYIRLQDADTTLSLIKEHHLVDAVADDIPGFVLLRVPSAQLKQASQDDLEDLSSDPIKLLVDEATHGVVEIEDVVTQLESASLKLFLFFYMRTLWRGESMQEFKASEPVRHRTTNTNLAADEGKLLVEQYADKAVELFAEYDRNLLMDFLHASTAYTYETAVKICERRHYIEELVYLLSKTGAMKKALFLIIDELDDVSKAISFAKEQDDKGLWNDFLEYSMSRPKFISGLLAEVGTAIDPIELLRRIPSGLEIEGLKDGLQKMIREYDLQDSISSGVARVLSSEVAVAMDTLRRGRRRGIKFAVPPARRRKPAVENNETTTPVDNVEDTSQPEISPGHCTGCQQAFTPDETETLIGFACGHVYHVSHLFHEPGHEDEHELTLPRLPKEDDEDSDYSSEFTRTVGPKVTSARLLKDKVEELGGCKACKVRKEKIAEV